MGLQYFCGAYAPNAPQKPFWYAPLNICTGNFKKTFLKLKFYF
jgi:hypothetical protein